MAARPFSRPAAHPAVHLSPPGPAARPTLGVEIGAVLVGTAAGFVVLALASFRESPGDPAVAGADWAGPVGAMVAGTLLRGFGVVAWLLPLELVALARPMVRGRAPDRIPLRAAGDLILGLLAAAVVQIVAPHTVAHGGLDAAGNVGLLFGELARGAFSGPGSLLVTCALAALILVGRSSLSAVELCQRAADAAASLGRRLHGLAMRGLEGWRAAHALRRDEAAAALAADRPRIETPGDEAIVAPLLAEDSDDADWAPPDSTGEPPLALSRALRTQSPPAAPRASETPAPPQAKAAACAPRGSEPAAAAPPEGELPTGAAPAASESDAALPQVGEPPPPAAPAGPARRPRRASAAEPVIVETRKELEVEKSERAAKPRARAFALPSPELLHAAPPAVRGIDREQIYALSAKLIETLAVHGVKGRVEEVQPGPTVTTYEVALEAGTKVRAVAALADDLQLGLSRKVRIVAPIPGKSRIGFELPNDERIPVNLRELVEDARFAKQCERAPLPVVLGRDIVGKPFYGDLASMPHVIVAGATGTGKSVGLNVMLASLLFSRTPDELRLLMVDPKVVELAPYDGIPHLLLPVVTDMKQAATALRWTVDEMERRYQLFANAGTRNLRTYNDWVDKIARGELAPPAPPELRAEGAVGGEHHVAPLPDRLPYIVVVIDEYADLVMQQGKEVETSVARLAQKARAAGMHVVVATQRPSVDVITGMIKANFPSRIAFKVAQKTDSRTVLDEQGAEWLLGAGDVLIRLNGESDTRRVQCPYVSEEEIGALCEHLRRQAPPQYNEDILRAAEEGAGEDGDSDEGLDALFDQAVAIVAETRRCSTSWLQRKLTIGYNRAAKLVESMERRGMVGPPNGAREREVLLPPVD
ncbi:MAG: DNA translocase FtsK 4TM domain-containing protein [Polyangiaceae bacterium]|nr:DNA translocase FtsK 4TM domain-containing protein [Polyangiaceae bacterium]